MSSRSSGTSSPYKFSVDGEVIGSRPTAFVMFQRIYMYIYIMFSARVKSPWPGCKLDG